MHTEYEQICLLMYAHTYANTHMHIHFFPSLNRTRKSHGKNAKTVPLRVRLHLLQILKVEVVARHWGMSGSLAWQHFPDCESFVSIWGTHTRCLRVSCVPKPVQLEPSNSFPNRWSHPWKS